MKRTKQQGPEKNPTRIFTKTAQQPRSKADASTEKNPAEQALELSARNNKLSPPGKEKDKQERRRAKNAMSQA